MTRQQFIDKATRVAERDLGIPAGWWGTWRDVYGPGGIRVSFMASGGWHLTQRGKSVSKHDSRAFAITKARKL